MQENFTGEETDDDENYDHYGDDDKKYDLNYDDEGDEDANNDENHDKKMFCNHGGRNNRCFP